MVWLHDVLLCDYDADWRVVMREKYFVTTRRKTQDGEILPRVTRYHDPTWQKYSWWRGIRYLSRKTEIDLQRVEMFPILFI